MHLHSTRLLPFRPVRRSGRAPGGGLALLRRAVALGALALPAASQGHLGQDFWLADPYTSEQIFTIAIGNPNAVTANVTLFNVIEGTTFGSVNPGAVKTFTFADHELAVQGSVVSANPVYHVTSDVDVAVFVFDPLANAAHNDACLVLPVPILGKRHRIANFVNPENSAGQFVGVVATLAGAVTNVRVIDDTQTVVDNVNLLVGEYFQRINSINVGATPADDMTGWEVVADQPVAVFSGSNITSVGLPSCCGDALLEQLLPETMLALGYAVAPLRTRPLGCTTPATCAADLFRFVATQNNTTITTTPNVGGGTLNEADYLEITTSTPFIVKGTKPFFGYQYLPSMDAFYGATPAAGTGDPALLDIIPVEQFRRDYIVHVEGSFPDNFLNIVAPTGSTLLLDNNPITAACDPIGALNGTSYCSMRVPVTSGAHKVTSSNRFGLTVSGFQVFGSYAYPAGLGMPCVAGPDGWMRDVPGDDGSEPDPSTANMWESPDIWVRNQQDTNLQFLHQHQNPIASATNYVYVKLRNRGCAPLEQGNVLTYFAKASTGLAWSANWIGSASNGDVIGTQPVGFLAANGELVLEYPWTPPATGHFCLLARLVSSDDPMSFAEGTIVHTNTKNNNNVAWKNVNVVPLEQSPAGGLTDYEVIVRNLEPAAVLLDVELGEPGAPLARSFLGYGAIQLTLPPAMLQAWELASGSSVGLSRLPGTDTFRVTATYAALTGIPLGVGEEHAVVLNFAQAPGRPPRLRPRLALEPYVIRQRSNGSATPDGGVTFTFPPTRGAPVPR